MSAIATLCHASYSLRLEQWRKIRDALDGEDCVKEQGTLYLPKPSGMNQVQYAAYKMRAVYYAVAERTLRGLVGMVLRTDPVFKLTPRLEAVRDVFTADGSSLEVLVDEIISELLSLGRYGILLDMPKNAPVGTAPVATTYFAEDILDWKLRYNERTGKKELCYLLLKDDLESNGGDIGHEYLELALDDAGLYTVRELKHDASGKTKELLEVSSFQPVVNGKHEASIPFFFANAYDLRPTTCKPPMLDLVNMNLSHYRNSADYEHALYLTAQPTPWIAGNLEEQKKPKSIGSGTIWYLPQDATCGMLEFTGAGITAQQKAMDDKEDRMAALGARMINDGKNRNETTDTARMRGRSEVSLLTSVVNMAQAVLNQLLRAAAIWAGESPDEVDCLLNHDWIEARMTSDELKALVEAWQGEAISRTTLHENLQRGQIVRAGRTMDEEVEEITEESGAFDKTPPEETVPPEEQPPGEEET